MSLSPGEAEVWAALGPVTDPELDQSIVDLGFIERVAVTGDRVEVAFRLPTFWCSANFAYIMAEDMRAALAPLGWAKEAEIQLVDHFAAEKINAGIAAGRGFREAFGAEADDDLRKIRETLRRKAWLGRMSALIEALREAGWSDERIVAVTVGELEEISARPHRHPGESRDPGATPIDLTAQTEGRLNTGSHSHSPNTRFGLRPLGRGLRRDDDAESAMDLAALAARFLEFRPLHAPSSAPDMPAFLMNSGPIAADALPEVLRDIRMTRRSMEANGEMCRILLKARYGNAERVDGEPVV